jgi:hypothetical protein
MIERELFEFTEMAWFNRAALPRSTHDRWQRKYEHTVDLRDFIESLPGYKVVRVYRAEKPTRFRYRDNGTEWDVLSITWICNWAQQAWNAGSYVELDCSFYVARPFVFCVPQIIVSHEAIPVGFIITPTERNRTYAWFMEDLRNADRCVQLREPYIILSDEGKGLKSFGRQVLKDGWKHFFCHRHLIEKFGASGYLGMLVTFILSLLTKQAFQKVLPLIRGLAKALLERHLIDQKHYDKFLKFLADPGELPSRTANGIVWRMESGVAVIMRSDFMEW